MKFGLPQCPLPADFWCTVQSPFYSAQLYLRITLCTRSDDSRICISNWRVGRISSDCFSLWDTPWIALHSNWVECSPAYGYDPGTLVLLWFPHLFAHITSAKFALYPLLFSHILPACVISAQIQCGTGISILNVLNCLCHSWQFLLLLCNAVAKPASILAKGGFLLSEGFYSHRQSRWFFTLKRTKKTPQAVYRLRRFVYRHNIITETPLLSKP